MSQVAVARHRPADNPFASHRVEGLSFRHEGATPHDLCQRLQRLGGRAAIIGPEGSGKTTLLEELALVVPGDPVRMRIGGGCRHPWRTALAQLPKPVTANHVVLVDGAEQLGPLGWRLLLLTSRPAQCLVATLHRPGLLPTLIECHTNHGLLCDLVSELVPADERALSPGLEELFERHHGNIRLCFRDLYDVYAGRTGLYPR